MGRRRRITTKVVDMHPKRRTDGQATFRRRDPETLHDVGGVGRERIQGEFDLHIRRYHVFILLLLVSPIQGNNAAIPQAPAGDMSITTGIERKSH